MLHKPFIFMLAALTSAVFFSPTAESAEFLFVENSNSGDVTVIAIPEHEVVASFHASEHPDDVVYAPDGRTAAAQRDFEAVEAGPQGLEWLFAQGCGLPFRLSLDNLDGDLAAADRERFAAAVVAQACAWQARGPGGRAGRFLEALAVRFPAGRGAPAMQFSLAALV